MNAVKWVIVDSTRGAATQNGERLSPAVLARIAEAVDQQLNNEFAREWGAGASVRAGADEHDVMPGEWVYGFVGSLPDAPGASAYHDIDKNGVPFSLCAVSTCADLLGPNGISVDASHEILETAGDAGANLFANDNKGTLHAMEMCDAVEVQTYGKTCRDGTVVRVSNWLMRAWFIPGAAGPYDYMTSAGLEGAVAPPGPMTTAPGNGGNYQIVAKAGDGSQVFASHAHAQAQPQAHAHILGTRRKGPTPNWSSRSFLRLSRMKGMGGTPT